MTEREEEINEQELNEQPQAADQPLDEQDEIIAQLRADLDESKQKYLYLYSEFESHRRIAAKDRMETMATAGREIMMALMPVVDDFDRAAKANPLSEGIELIRTKLESTLQQKGLRRMELAVGDAFNADEHEAVAELPASTPEQKGTIVDVLEQGYTLGGKIIRFAKVVVFSNQ